MAKPPRRNGAPPQRTEVRYAGGGIAWVALLFALASLVLAYMAYDRVNDMNRVSAQQTPVTLQSPVVQQSPVAVQTAQPATMTPLTVPASPMPQVQTTPQTTQPISTGQELENRLAKIRDDLRRDKDYQQARQAYNDLRQDIQRSYENAGVRSRQAWQSVQQDMNRLGQQLEQGSDQALQSLDNLIDRIRMDLGGGEQRR